MAYGQSLYDWCIENGEYGQQLLFEFGDGNNSQQFFDEETGMFKCPLDYTKGSPKKVKWTCKNNHVWFADIGHRTCTKRGCPQCSVTRVAIKRSTPTQGVNDLYTWCLNNGEWGQQLLQEWVGIDEDGNKVESKNILRGSSRIRVLWKCNKGHTWYATVNSRTLCKSRCPHCFSSRIVREDNNLYQWCLNNGEYGKQLLQEFQGIDEQGNRITLTEITSGSNKKILWKCNKGHTWYATVYNRTCLKSGCPHCKYELQSIKQSTPKQGINDFHTWCLNNGEYGKQLLQEFQGIDEHGNKIKPTEIARSTTMRVLWKCSKGHSWYTKVCSRTDKIKHNCPYCSNELQSIKRSTPKQGTNDLHTWCLNNGEWGQQLLQEFQGIDEHGNKITPTEITFGSSTKKVLWKCNKGHTWYATAKHRTLCKSGCPQCFSSNIVREDNNLYQWCLNNEEWGQQLLQEFQGIDEKDNKITPTEITSGSHKKVKWTCNKGHTWYATVLNRTFNKNGCPYCSASGTSYPEQFLYKALLQIYPKTISRGRYKGTEYDIAIPEEKICIEYSGIAWHADKLDRDEMKANICREHNVRFIQIYAHNGEIDTEDIFDKNQIIYRVSSGIDKHNQQLVYILDHILKYLGHSISEIDIKKAQTDAYNVIKSFKGKRL